MAGVASRSRGPALLIPDGKSMGTAGPFRGDRRKPDETGPKIFGERGGQFVKRKALKLPWIG